MSWMCQPECLQLGSNGHTAVNRSKTQASRLCSWMSGRHGRLWLSVSRKKLCVVAVLMWRWWSYLNMFLILDALLDAEHALALLPCVYCESFFVWLVLDCIFNILLKSRSRSAKTISVFVGFFDFILCPEAVVVLQICLLRLYYVLKRCVHSNNFEETQTV